jgi:hypothetical protein
LSVDLYWLAKEKPEARDLLATALDQKEKDEFAFHWQLLARREQRAPDGDWRIWMIMAGRGFGKTRAGAEWVRQIAEADPTARIALVSASLAEARAVMVEGESGLLAVCPLDRLPVFEPSLRRVRFPNGAQAQLFSAAEPESLRGPQHSHACGAGSEGAFRQSGARSAGCAIPTRRNRDAGRSSGLAGRRRLLQGLWTCHRRVGSACGQTRHQRRRELAFRRAGRRDDAV